MAEQEINPFDVPDEEFLDQPLPDEEVVEEEEPGEAPTEDPTPAEEEEAPVEEEQPEGEDPDGEAPQESESGDEDDVDDSGEGESEGAEDPEAEAEGSEGDQDDDPEEEEGEEESEDDTPDFKQFYEQVTAAFRANGKDMKVTDPADIQRLMSMGANYNKKMHALKPHLQTLKMLEKQELLDESKLSFAIDLMKGSKEAIAKLLQDQNIDPLELNDANTEYKPGTYTVDAREVDLDQTLDELKEEDPQAYNKTLDVLSNKWDEASKKALVSNPEDIRILNTHIRSGIYDRVMEEVENQKALGRLMGMSNLQAYQVVGDAMHAQGKFNDLVGNQREEPSKPAAEKPAAPTKPKVDDAKRKSKKRAASPSKGRTTQKTSEQDFNPLGVSDEDFLKNFDEKLM